MAYLLIADDDEDFAAAAEMVLRNAGHEVGVRHNLGDALANMETRAPDLLILDVMFPESASAGFDFARQLSHRQDKLKDIPILLLTAVNSRFPLGFSSRDIDSDWLPVCDFLEKPVELALLPGRVEALLARSASPPPKS